MRQVPLCIYSSYEFPNSLCYGPSSALSWVATPVPSSSRRMFLQTQVCHHCTVHQGHCPALQFLVTIPVPSNGGIIYHAHYLGIQHVVASKYLPHHGYLNNSTNLSSYDSLLISLDWQCSPLSSYPSMSCNHRTCSRFGMHHSLVSSFGTWRTDSVTRLIWCRQHSVLVHLIFRLTLHIGKCDLTTLNKLIFRQICTAL